MLKKKLVLLGPLIFSIHVHSAPVEKPQTRGAVARAKTPPGPLVTASAGAVAGEPVTARQILISSLIEDALFRKKPEKLSLGQLEKPAYSRETSVILLEAAIWLESKGFPVANVSSAEIAAKKRELLKVLRSSSVWNQWAALKVQEQELALALQRKLAAKKLIQFKVETASLPVTDQEAEDYYKKNRLKYDQLPFENFRDNIKTFLAQRQVEERLQEWFEVLKVKYRIQNHLASRAL